VELLNQHTPLRKIIELKFELSKTWKMSGPWKSKNESVFKSLIFTLAWLMAAAVVAVGHAQSCIVDGGSVYQRIDGFGASSAFSGRTWSQSQANLFFSTNHTAFVTGIGLSLLRNQIQPGGYATASEIGLMKMAQADGARVWSTPWTPQASFKDNNNQVGGNFLSASNQAYASQLAGYVANMQKANGVYVYALSIQNEPDANVNYVSCHWSAQQFHDFVPYLYNALAASNVSSTKIMLPESENWNDPQGLAATAMNDPAVAADVGIIADHDYGGGTGPQSGYGKTHWETEVSTFDPYDGSITNAMYWANKFHLFMTSAQVNAYHYWWLVSGNADNEGLTDQNGNAAKRMYALGNFSRFIRPGYYRIGVNNTASTALISAYRYPNSGDIAIVAINTGTASINQVFTLTNLPVPVSMTPWITSSNLSLANQTDVIVASSSYTYTLPPMSVVTFVWATNLAPTDIVLLNSTVQENLPSGATVGNLLALDPNCANTFTYTLVSGTGSDDNASFSLTGGTLKTAAKFNYQAKKSYSIRVRSTDQDGLFFEKAFTITVAEGNETPVFTPVADQTINAGLTLMITNSVTDPDVPPLNLNFNLLAGPTNATLTADGSGTNAIFTWRPRVSQVGTTNPVSVQVTDSGSPNLSATNNFNVIVNPLTQPVLGSVTFSNGLVNLVVNGDQGPDYTLLTSTDLINWQALFTNNSPLMPITLVDTNSTDAARFYRVQIGP
jgi:glucuronoarabinoxylan endo-1,4-beta-xylanase